MEIEGNLPMNRWLAGRIRPAPEGPQDVNIAQSKKQRILFVDDEPAVLDGLRRALRVRKDWEVRLAGSGRDALALLASESFDAVVTDMRMPGMSGAELLVEVRNRFPETVRLVLSGHTDPAALRSCVGVAHQCLSKPCSFDVLSRTVQRSIRNEARGASRAVRELVGRLDHLPTIPAVYSELTEILADPDACLEDVGRVVEKDGGLSAKLLQLVNSAFFGLSRPLANPVAAVSYLGIETIKSLVLSMDVFSRYQSVKAGGVDLSEEWRHAMATAEFARRLVRHAGGDGATADAAFTAGLLHDAGKLVLAFNRAEDYGEVDRMVREDGLAREAAEARVFGCSHADVGGYLFGLWGLPPAVVEAIGSHQEPETSDEAVDAGMTPLVAVYVSNRLDHGQPLAGEEGPEGVDGGGSGDGPSVFLATRGFVKRVGDWRERYVEWKSGQEGG